MKLTSFTDYSLRVLIYLGIQPQRLATIAEIAEAYEISEHHLTKVVHFLGKSGWLANIRGKGGGMRLARPLHEITVGAVVRQTEREAALVECQEPAGGNCCISPVCTLRGVLEEAFAAFHAVLDGYTMEDLLHNRVALLRHFPVETQQALTESKPAVSAA